MNKGLERLLLNSNRLQEFPAGLTFLSVSSLSDHSRQHATCACGESSNISPQNGYHVQISLLR